MMWSSRIVVSLTLRAVRLVSIVIARRRVHCYRRPRAQSRAARGLGPGALPAGPRAEGVTEVWRRSIASMNWDGMVDGMIVGGNERRCGRRKMKIKGKERRDGRAQTERRQLKNRRTRRKRGREPKEELLRVVS